jgi:hypothetical protein
MNVGLAERQNFDTAFILACATGDVINANTILNRCPEATRDLNSVGEKPPSPLPCA